MRPKATAWRWTKLFSNWNDRMGSDPKVAARLAGALLLVAVLSSCGLPSARDQAASANDALAPERTEGGVPRSALTLPHDAETAERSANARQCDKIGGTWRQDGMLGGWYCFRLYSDGGLTCTDSGQCEGECRIEQPNADAGMCQADSSPFGCRGELIDGRSNGFVCVD